MNKYRVFVTKTYIDVLCFDIESSDIEKARSIAEKVATKIKPDSRSEAVDNGWHSDDGIEIESLGYYANGNYPCKEVYRNKKSVVYMFETDKGSKE